MRVLATIGFSFSAGVFLAALLPWNGWQLYAAGGVLLLALAWLFAARRQKYFRRGLLILLPLALVAIAYALGLRGVELFLVIAVFATPVASGSYPMAQNMGGDGELAGQLVFLSTVISVFTLFGWILVLRLMCTR